MRRKLVKFADLYRGSPDDTIRGNQTECYAHMFPKVGRGAARVRGSHYFNHPIVQEHIQEKADEIGEQADVTQARVLQEVARLGLYDVRKLFDADGRPLAITELTDEMAAAIVGVEVVTIGSGEAGLGEIRKYKLADKNSALEKLMKHLGLYEKDNNQRAKSLSELLQEVRNNE